MVAYKFPTLVHHMTPSDVPSTPNLNVPLDLALDEMYQAALRAGAGGGKLLGAGGGGFFLFAGCWNHQNEIERALGLRRDEWQ